MTDAPKPPRPGFPPPLPGAFTEPFPKAKSDPPPSEEEPPPTRRERMNSTPPSGSLLLSHLVDKLSDEKADPRDQLIKDQALTIKLYQQKVTELSQMPNTTPSPVPGPPKSKAMMAAQTVGALGKWTTIVMGVLGLAATVAHQFRPDLEGPIQFFIKLLGGQP